jgi:hypothetical protein
MYAHVNKLIKKRENAACSKSDKTSVYQT